MNTLDEYNRVVQANYLTNKLLSVSAKLLNFSAIPYLSAVGLLTKRRQSLEETYSRLVVRDAYNEMYPDD